MSRERERLSDYLEHIMEAINRIERYTQDMDERAFVGLATPNSPWHLHTKCATLLPTATRKSICKLSGERSKGICRGCSVRFMRWLKPFRRRTMARISSVPDRYGV